MLLYYDIIQKRVREKHTKIQNTHNRSDALLGADFGSGAKRLWWKKPKEDIKNVSYLN
jgi:hypothetical protein